MSAESIFDSVPDFPPLVLDDCECHYDLVAAMATITYTGEITSQITASVYKWMGDTLKLLPEGHRVRGCIFDFTAVKETSASNITTARTHGKNFRQEHEPIVTSIPTALVVNTLYQELLVDTMMKLAKHVRDDKQSHIRLVKSRAEAEAFINEWHQ